MNLKINFLLICFIISIVLQFSIISALGITPARTTIDFIPNLEREVQFSVLNSENQDLNLVMYAQGELNQSIFLESNSFSLSKDEESLSLKYTIKLPSVLSPGLHVAEVVVLSLPGGPGNSRAFVGAAVGVATQVHVYVPYPGKFIEAALDVINTDVGGEAVFVIPVLSRGNLDVESVRANIDIYNKLNEKVVSFNTNEISVPSGERKELVYKWNVNVQPGIYRAVATVISDENTQTIEQQFSIGSPDLELQEVKVDNFNLGGIAKLEMLVENKWSEEIIGAYAQTQVFDTNSQVIADFKSPTYDIPSFSKEGDDFVLGYGRFKGGEYDSKVYLKYGEKSSRQDIKFRVNSKEIKVIGLGYVISEAEDSEGKGESSFMVVLIVGIVVLVLINLTWFMIVRKKLNQKVK